MIATEKQMRRALEGHFYSYDFHTGCMKVIDVGSVTSWQSRYRAIDSKMPSHFNRRRNKNPFSPHEDELMIAMRRDAKTWVEIKTAMRRGKTVCMDRWKVILAREKHAGG